MGDSVTYEVVDRVAVITIERPEKRNAMSLEVFDGLLAASQRAEEESVTDDGVGAVLVRGAGGVFSAGIDTSVFGGQLREPPSGDFIAGLQSSLTAFEDLPVPSVAAIEGFCFGGGLQLAAACHVRLVAPGAELSLMETRWGIVPDLGGTYRIPRLVGLGRATDMAMTARRVSAEEAVAMGLCDRLLVSDDPQEEALAHARGLAAGPGAVRRIPALMRQNLRRGRQDALEAERETQLQVMAGPDFAEAVAAAFEDRAPRFVGR